MRMHPPALAYTFNSWCVALAGILYFSMLEARPMLHPWLIVILLSITIPVTTLLIARGRCSTVAAPQPRARHRRSARPATPDAGGAAERPASTAHEDRRRLLDNARLAA
ncbi:MAG: monovalent cation/H(+) antiporter subunit G [Hyphomicrobium sp.]